MNMDQENAIIEQAKTIIQKRLTFGNVFSDPTTVKNYFILRLAGKKHEVFACLFLTTRNALIRYEELFSGTINHAPVFPRIIAQRALELNAHSIILGHNHPSGSEKYSSADLDITRRIADTLGLFDIKVLDHIVVGGANALSFAEQRLL